MHFAPPAAPQVGGVGVSPARRPLSLLGTLPALLKLRLVVLVVFTTAAGYFLGAGPPWCPRTLFWTILGTALAAAGSMALNQRLEMARDGRMERTRTRPLPAGQLRPATATALGVGSATLGVFTLALGVGPRPALLAAAVILLYLLVYTPLKPRTSANTLVGAVCGAIPPLIGWAAGRGEFGAGAWVLFGILFFWQVPHFLALAWLYRADYARGGFRMLPADDPEGYLTALAAVLHSAALAPLPLVAALLGLTGWFGAVGSLLLVAWLLWEAVRLGHRRSDAAARRLFLTSLAVLPLVLTLMVLDRGGGYPSLTGLAAAPPAPHRGAGLAVTQWSQ